MKTLKDLFSKQAATYAANRPGYPQALFDFLFGLVPGFQNAWDCATGNGQVACRLADRFLRVYATDISSSQLAHAAQHERISYEVMRVEDTTFPDNTFDLITAGTAVHWFDFNAFYAEVFRVARKGAIFAAWAYAPCMSDPQTDELIIRLQHDIVGSYWDPERRYVDNHYRDIPFPFEEIPAPSFNIEVFWTIDQLLGYLHSWSSVQHYVRDKGEDPVLQVEEGLRSSWGPAVQKYFTFPVFLRVGRVLK